MKRHLVTLPGFLLLATTAGAQLVRTAATTVDLPAAPAVITGYSTENALGTLTFDGPMVATSAPGETDRLFVALRGGVLQAVTGLAATPAKSDWLSLSGLLADGESLRTNGENGFLSVAFHPQFAANGTLFVYFSLRAPGAGGTQEFQRLHRVVVADPQANPAVVASHEPLLTILDRASNHNGGDLHFGPDGYLYLSLGDEGGGGDQYDNARYITQRLEGGVARTGFWGKLIRIDVDRNPDNPEPNPGIQNSEAYPTPVHAGAYRIPADNPFVGATTWHNEEIDPADVRTEIWATGLRNPFRWSFDPQDGRLFLGDVGQGTYEEIDVVTRGADLGWSWREGLHAYSNPPSPRTPPAEGFDPVDPIYEYDHTNNGSGNDSVIYGNSVTGGAVYRGSRLPELSGAYVFADYGSGRIAALRESETGWTGQRLATNAGIVDFGYDPRNGDLLFCNLNNGSIRRLVRNVSGTEPPATLSATGIFAGLTTLEPQPGVVAYEPNVESWNDHASVRRWFAVRGEADRIGFDASGHWTFPAGTAWVQHFDMESVRGDPASARPLETRILVKTADDVYGLSYRWRDDGSDADLVPDGGQEIELAIVDGGEPVAQTWRIPARSDCRTCHTSAGGYALSFRTEQLNRAHSYGGVSQNQIAALSDAGYFAEPATGIAQLPALTPAGDTSASLEWRVRSYLDANCAHCHRPGGTAAGNWDARASVATDDAGLVLGLLTDNRGNPENRVVVPGNPALSMLLQRLAADDVPRMPPAGPTLGDAGAIALLTEWISGPLTTRQGFAEWQVAHFGEPLPPEAAADADPDADGSSNAAEFVAGTSPVAANPPVAAGVTVGADALTFAVEVPANRSCIVESAAAPDGTWAPWDVPGNSPFFRAEAGTLTLTGSLPSGDSRRFLRARFQAP